MTAEKLIYDRSNIEKLSFALEELWLSWPILIYFNYHHAAPTTKRTYST